MSFNRRNFLKWGTAYLAASGVFADESLRGSAQTAPVATGAAAPLMLSVSARDRGQQISAHFLGLSFEAAAVADPAFLRPDNRSLVTLLENLNSRGVIRIGGNTSDFTQFQPDVGAAFDLAPGALQHRKKVTMLAAGDIRQLAEFVRSAGWSLIWGVNLGTGSPPQAAEEAAVVASAMGYALSAIQIGNEPNLYHENGLRGTSYGFPTYLTEWRTYAQAIQARVPGIPLAGPDSAGDSRWFMQMADQAAADLSLLTQHHYAEGPGSSPASTIDRMLSAKSSEKQLAQALRDAADAAGLPYRVSETNSCYGGGRYGVSDTLAAALWAVNFLFTLAAAGCSGVNFHGGPAGAYTPVARAANGVDYEPRPLYYALLLFASVSDGHIVRVHFATPAPSGITAYAVRHDSKELSVIVINSDAARSADIMVDAGAGYTKGSILRLSGSSLAATTDVVLGNSVVNSDGRWQPKTIESVLPRNGLFPLTVSAASVAALRLS